MSTEKFRILIENLLNSIDGAKSVAIVSQEGLIVESVLEDDISEIKLAAMTATILSVAERVLAELRSGILDNAALTGDEGIFIVMSAGKELILAVCLDLDARMDTCFIEMRKAAQQLEKFT